MEERILNWLLGFCCLLAFRVRFVGFSLLRALGAEAERLSATSATDFPASSRFGFFSADIASLSSASIFICAFFFAFTLAVRLLMSTSRRENRLEFSTPPLFACTE
jgi:hypothetical protein